MSEDQMDKPFPRFFALKIYPKHLSACLENVQQRGSWWESYVKDIFFHKEENYFDIIVGMTASYPSVENELKEKWNVDD